MSNTVNVAAPTGVVENDVTNNSATDIDTLLPSVDLVVTKTNNVDVVVAGSQTSYTIIVSNEGPNGVTAAEVVDAFPSVLTNISYTSVAAGGASGNSNGNGDINDTVNLPSGSSITYTVLATLDSQATGQLINQATVTAPDTVTDIDLTNNSSTDTDTIDQAMAEISGFVYVDLDDDGVQDPGEPGIPGVEIQLEQDAAQIGSTFTDANGFYQFIGLDAGTYDVVEVQPEGWLNGKQTVGGDIGEVSGENRFTVPLESGDMADQLNFGELLIRPSKRWLLASSFRNAGTPS